MLDRQGTSKFTRCLVAAEGVATKSEADAWKLMHPITLQAVEMMKGFNPEAWKKANAEFGLENFIPMGIGIVYKGTMYLKAPFFKTKSISYSIG